MGSIITQNFTPLPNVLLDEIIPRLRQGEIRVILAITRYTAGFQKTTWAIGYGKLARITGLSRRHVARAVVALHKKGYLAVTSGASERVANVHGLRLAASDIHGTSDSNDTSVLFQKFDE